MSTKQAPALVNRQRIKRLKVEDDFSRKCVYIAVEHGMCGEHVATAGLARAGSGAAPERSAQARGPEFTSRALLVWEDWA
jgi:putative transposase